MTRHAVLFLILGALIGGCEPTPEEKEAKAWFSAVAARTLQGYQDYLATWPDAKYSKDAAQHLENLAWREAAWAHTSAAYNGFLQKWPNSLYASLAEEMLAWKKKHAHTRDTHVTLSLILRISPDPTGREPSETEKQTNNAVRLLECAGYAVNSFSSDESEYRSALLDIQISLRPIEGEYTFDGSRHTVASGSEVSGTIQWTSSDGHSTGPIKFSETDPPPGALIMSRNKLEKIIAAAQLRSIGRVLEARGSYWDQFTSIALERAGPQAYLCPTYVLDKGAHWARARSKTAMPVMGATVAALFSKEWSKSREALKRLLSSNAPAVRSFLARYLDAYRATLNSDDVKAIDEHVGSRP